MLLRDFFRRLISLGRGLARGLGLRPEEVANRLIAEGRRAESEGRLDEACRLYDRAVAAAPRYEKAHLNLGFALEAAGREAAAVAAYESALAINPRDPYASYNLGRLLHTRGAQERAKQLLRTALESKPDFSEAHVLLSSVHDSEGNLAAALASLEEALRQRPDYAGAWHNYGDVLWRSERRADAVAALRRSIELDPTSPSALYLLAHILRSESRVGEALEAIGAARKLAPERFDLESMELHALNLFDGISEEALSIRHRAFGARLEQTHAPRFAPLGNSRDPERRLRLGYVSSDFNLHPVAWFMIPVLERHDRRACEVYCYYTNFSTDDATRQLRERADAWRDAAKMSDSELADTVNRDAIDILIDLTGHSGRMRLGAFAERPAPVQVTWLGYLNTTGLARVHYRLCDPHTDPPGLTEHLHTETLVRLPTSQWCYRPVVATERAPEAPLGRNGFVTFASFNHAAKISSTVRSLWMEILSRVPGSRLVVVGMPEGHARDGLLEAFRSTGIAASRLTVVPRVPLDRYFSWFNAIDIALDSTPYSGGTTTCDALWMGVPVVTTPGTRSVSRSAASILSAVGLPECIASTPEDYVRLAVELARERTTVMRLRTTLRQRMRESSLMDEAGFVRDLEAAYRDMWRRWCESDDRG